MGTTPSTGPPPGPQRYRDPHGDLVEAARWESARLEYAGAIIGWLGGHGMNYRCVGGCAPHTGLELTSVTGDPLRAKTGDYVLRRLRDGFWTVVDGAEFETHSTPVH